ncbi:MAG: IS1595 family transposase [Candidatus Binataceae bacterium]
MKLIDIHEQFSTADKCLDYLEAMRWPKGACCIACGSVKVSRITREAKSKNKRTRIYQCLEKECRHQFSPTAGTIFHDSHLPLEKWFFAIAIICEAKKGVSACQMQRHLGVNYRTAWHLCHRIREAMKDDDSPLTGVVEIDETYIGGRVQRRGDRKKPKRPKDVVIGMVERGGRLRFTHIRYPIATSRNVKPR